MYKDEQNTDVPFFPTNYEIIKHAWFKVHIYHSNSLLTLFTICGFISNFVDPLLQTQLYLIRPKRKLLPLSFFF